MIKQYEIDVVDGSGFRHTVILTESYEVSSGFGQRQTEPTRIKSRRYELGRTRLKVEGETLIDPTSKDVYRVINTKLPTGPDPFTPPSE